MVIGIDTVFFLLVIISIVIIYIMKEAKEKEELKNILKGLAGSKGPENYDSSSKNNIGLQLDRNQLYLKQNALSEDPRQLAGNPIYKIVITGGPCGGKSTSLQRIQKQMTQKGFRVFSVPQIPTLVVQAGGMILMSEFTMQQRIKFQSLLIKFQMYAEDYFTRLAQMSKSPSIIICDRGVVDPAAYVSKEEFQAIMDSQGWTWTSLRDRRYDAVIHLVTAAIGAEKFYTRSNNNARSENVQLAKLLDHKTLDAWSGHPNITVCPNIPDQSFDKKIETTIRAVHQTVGLQVKDNRYQRFLIQQPVFPQDVKVETSDVEEVFLINQDQRWSEDKIIRRGQNDSHTYQRKYRCKKNKQGDYPQELRVPLTSLQYVQLRSEKADPKLKTVGRKRLQFIIENVQYSIDVYQQLYNLKPTCILRFANPENVDTSQLLPKFIEIVKDVREDSKYSIRAIAEQ